MGSILGSILGSNDGIRDKEKSIDIMNASNTITIDLISDDEECDYKKCSSRQNAYVMAKLPLNFKKEETNLIRQAEKAEVLANTKYGKIFSECEENEIKLNHEILVPFVNVVGKETCEDFIDRIACVAECCQSNDDRAEEKEFILNYANDAMFSRECVRDLRKIQKKEKKKKM